MSESKPTTTTLLKTDEMWTGEKLPNYLIGNPEIIINKVIIPPNSKLKWHHHDVMSFGYVIEGEFYLVTKDGKEICQTKEKHLQKQLEQFTEEKIDLKKIVN